MTARWNRIPPRALSTVFANESTAAIRPAAINRQSPERESAEMGAGIDPHGYDAQEYQGQEAAHSCRQH